MSGFDLSNLLSASPTSNIFLGAYNTGDEYNILLESLMANTANQKVLFDYNSSGSLNIGGTLNVGQDVLCFVLQVKTPFDGATPYITLGTQADPDYFKPGDSIDLTEANTYIILPQNIEFGSIIQPKMYLNIPGASQGEAVLYMIYNAGI